MHLLALRPHAGKPRVGRRLHKACGWGLVLRHGAPLLLPLLLLLLRRLQGCLHQRWRLRLRLLPLCLPAMAVPAWVGHMHLLQVV